MTATFEHPDNNDRGDKETKGLMDFVADHDKNRKALQETLKKVISSSDGITQDVAQVINLRAHQVIDTWRRMARCILESSDTMDDFATSIATLMMKDEQDRAQFLNNATGKDVFVPVYDGDTKVLKHNLVNVLARIEESVAEKEVQQTIIDMLAHDYEGSMSADMQTLEAVIKEAQIENRQEPEVVTNSWQDRVKALLPKLGAHALDVAKLAAGVGIGVAIGSRLGRRSQ